MRKLPLISITFLGLMLSVGLAACDGDDGNADTTSETTNGDGDGDGDGDENGDGDGGPGDGDGAPGCFDAPDECLRFVGCIGALVPAQLETVEAEYGPGGSCWCSGEDAAQDCYKTCVEQLATAVKNNPTEQACHENSCTVDQLDPDEPYGPVVNGSCPDWSGNPQLPLNMPFGIPGSVCSPPCSGIANACPEHSQTSAQGSCYLQLGEDLHCVSRCYVDSTVIGGTQCQCGATCQPQGGADGEGNLRGICTYVD